LGPLRVGVDSWSAPQNGYELRDYYYSIPDR